jgi:class 3 adenylate cyclase
MAANAKQAALKRVEASRLGKVLSEQMTRKVIVAILLMLFTMPLLRAEQQDLSKEWGLQTLFWYGSSDCSLTRSIVEDREKETWKTGAAEREGKPIILESPSLYCHTKGHADAWIFKEGFDAMIYQYSQTASMTLRSGGCDDETEDCSIPHHQLLWLHIPDLKDGALRDIGKVDSAIGSWKGEPSCYGNPLPEGCIYRQSEIYDVSYVPEECLENYGAHECSELTAYARFETKKDAVLASWLSLIQMLLVMIILAFFSAMFNMDTQVLVISPIEKMVSIIKQRAEDPLRPPAVSVEAGGPGKKKKSGPQLETSMLEQTILRIGELLQRGFGAAGAEIVGANMSSGDGDLNIMMPGARVSAIFGYTNVRDFTVATAVLEEDVLCFLNTLGNIVQSCVHRWSGVANRNVGDAFVVLWKVPELDSSKRTGTAAADAVSKVSEIADRSLMAFVKIIAEMRRSMDVQFYNDHPVLQKQIDRWRVRIGMALHVGWAIEGPVGSDFKIDASYLSPTVALCELLESSTKVYGLPLIISESQYKILSLRAKERMRKIDVVKVMDRVLGLYVFNVNFESAVDEMPIGADGRVMHEYGELVKDEGLHDIGSATLEKEGAEFLFVIDRDATKLQEGIPEELNLEYRDALCQMIEGNWEPCAEILVRILRTLWPGDGPAEAMYRYMSEYSFKCPPNWNGYHVLDAETLAHASRDPVDLDDDEVMYSPSGPSPRYTNTKPQTPTTKNGNLAPEDDGLPSRGAVSFARNTMGSIIGFQEYSGLEDPENMILQWRKGDWR